MGNVQDSSVTQANRDQSEAAKKLTEDRQHLADQKTAQDLILEHNKELAEINAKQAETSRVAQFAKKGRRGGELTDTEVNELERANTPQAVRTLKSSGHYPDPATKIAKGAAEVTVAATAVAALGPVGVPIAAAAKVLERAFKPKP